MLPSLKKKTCEILYLRRVLQLKVDWTAPDALFFDSDLYRAAGPAIVWLAMRDDFPLWPILKPGKREKCDVVDLYRDDFFAIRNRLFFELWIPAVRAGQSSGFLQLPLQNRFQSASIELHRDLFVARLSKKIQLEWLSTGRKKRSDGSYGIYPERMKRKLLHSSLNGRLITKDIEMSFPENHLNSCQMLDSSVEILETILESKFLIKSALYCSSTRIRLSADSDIQM